MAAAILALGVPLAVILIGRTAGVGVLDTLRHPIFLVINLGFVALPHCAVWWLAFRRGEQRSAECLGGLAGANVVYLLLAILGLVDSETASWLWFIYWPLCALGILGGVAVGARLGVRFPFSSKL